MKKKSAKGESDLRTESFVQTNIFAIFLLSVLTTSYEISREFTGST